MDQGSDRNPIRKDLFARGSTSAGGARDEVHRLVAGGVVAEFVEVSDDFDPKTIPKHVHQTAAPVLDASDEVLGILGYRELVLDGLWVETQAES